jgi:hypothetical protein
VKNALNEGWLSVVFCSDAASEGLNLQAARVIINIDVPWNPAKLEQRIGRIDRLGQASPTVDIYNLWFPNSVEANMYERLLARREYWQLAVGETPDLVGDAIRIELSHRLGSREMLRSDPFETLQSLRTEFQHRAMAKVWDVQLQIEPISLTMRKELLKHLAEAALAKGWEAEMTGDGALRIVTPGSPGWILRPDPGPGRPFTLLDPTMDLMTEMKSHEGRIGDRAELCVLEEERIPYAFCLRIDNDVFVLPSESFPSLLDAALNLNPLQFDGRWKLPLPGDEETYESEVSDTILRSARWLPDHSAMRSPVSFEGAQAGVPPPPGRKSDWKIRRLGVIPISRLKDL